MIVVNLPLTSLSGADIANTIVPEDFEWFQSRGAVESNVIQVKVGTKKTLS
jgi:hypothetical protein